MKKKYLTRLSILSCLLLFVLSGYTFASWSRGEFELYGTQVFSQVSNNENDTFYINWWNSLLSSNIYAQYVDNIPFDSYDNLFIRYGTNDIFALYLFNSDATFFVDSSGYFKTNKDINMNYALFFNCDRRNLTFSFNNEKYNDWLFSNNSQQFGIFPSTSILSKPFIIPFTQNTITNQYNKLIYGLNMTANMPVYNGTTNVDNGEYYKLSSGFVGSYYYDNDNYQNLEYKIISNTSEEYIGLKNIYYTPDSNGQKVDIYIYISPDMSQKGYKVVLYYNEEVLYQENAYNTLIVNGRWFFWR